MDMLRNHRFAAPTHQHLRVAIGLPVVRQALQACIAFACCSAALASGSTPTPTTIALTGTDGVYGPNAGPGVVFYTFLGPEVNAAGQMAWGGETGTGSNHTPAIWSGSGAARSPLIVPGMPLSGIPGAQYSTINQYGVWLNDSGQTIFDAVVSGATTPSYNGTTYVSVSGSGTTIIARRPAGGGPFPPDPLRFNAISGFRSNGSQSIAFYGDQSGSELWLGQPGSVASVAKAGSQAPGTPAGTIYSPALFTVELNRSGSLLYFARLQNAGGTTLDTAMYINNGSTSTLLVRASDPAPGIPLSSIGSLGGAGALSDDGQASVISANGLFIGKPGALRLSAAPGRQAPGMQPGIQFADVQGPYSDGPGRFVFSANLTGPTVTPFNSLSTWIDEGSGPRLIARDGQSAPGLPAGVVLYAAQAHTGNRLGQFLIDANLLGPGVNSSNDVFAAVWDPVVGLLSIARSGDTILLGTGVTKTIESFSDVNLSVLNPGSPIPGSTLLSPASGPVGIVTYIAYFTDNTSGTFSLIVPSPGAGALALLFAMPAAVRRRRRTPA